MDLGGGYHIILIQLYVTFLIMEDQNLTYPYLIYLKGAKLSLSALIIFHVLYSYSQVDIRTVKDMVHGYNFGIQL